MVPAARSSRRMLCLAVALATTLGCASSGKKKVAAAESKYSDEPAPRWESAGETLPPPKPAIPPPPPAPPAVATTAPPKGAATVPGKNGARAATPAKVGTRVPEIGKPEAGPKTVTTTTAARPLTTTAGATQGAPGAARQPVSDRDLLAPVLTFDAPAGKASPPPKAEAPVARVAPKPEPSEPPERESRPEKESRPTEPVRPEPRAEPREVDDAPPPRRAQRERDREREEEPRSRRAVDEDAPPELPASAKRGDLRATIAGKRIVFRRGVILGNRKHGYALQAFESTSNSTTSRSGEVNARIELDLVRGRVIPITLIYLQVPDEGPKSAQGVRALSCAGKGALVLDVLPPLPKKLPRREELDIGDADGALSIQVVCSRDSREYGAFSIEGRLLSRVLITPPDL